MRINKTYITSIFYHENFSSTDTFTMQFMQDLQTYQLKMHLFILIKDKVNCIQNMVVQAKSQLYETQTYLCLYPHSTKRTTSGCLFFIATTCCSRGVSFIPGRAFIGPGLIETACWLLVVLSLLFCDLVILKHSYL